MSKKKISILVVMGVFLSCLLVPNVFATTPASKITIDMPSNNSSVVNSVYIAGWTLSEVDNKSY